MTTATTQHPLIERTRRFAAQAQPRRVRTLREFAEQEFVIPTGPDAGDRFNVDRQPVARFFLDAVDTNRWQRIAITAGAQQGKTVLGFLIVALWHLFEWAETVILGVPTMAIARDKWRDDLLPAIRRTRYASLLPRTGGGSRGGEVEAILFGNGAVLRFMSGGGDDATRSHYTARVVIITEVDRLDEIGTTARESDKVAQLFARTKAWGDRRRFYLECTPSFKDGRIWQEVTKRGTNSVVELRCPECRKFVDPGRESLFGWQDAETILEARDNAYFGCPGCGAKWTEEQRYTAVNTGRLVHRREETDTLGFHWNAARNVFATAGDVAADEWAAARAPNEIQAEREMHQFVWGLPVNRIEGLGSVLTIDALAQRVDANRLTKGRVPVDTEWLTVGVDLGRRLGHYVSIAWMKSGAGHVVDYGTFDIPADDLGDHQAMLVALRDFEEFISGGYAVEGKPNKTPNQIWVDSKWHYPERVVFGFCRERTGPSGTALWRPTRGFGEGTRRLGRYFAPTKHSKTTVHVGEQYHIVRLDTDGVYVVDVNSDFWKTAMRDRLAMPLDAPGALTVFAVSNRNEHMRYVKHLGAERPETTFVPGRGEVTKWVTVSRANHYLDATCLSLAAGHFCGVRVLAYERPSAQAAPRRRRGPSVPRITARDGRPFLVSER